MKITLFIGILIVCSCGAPTPKVETPVIQMAGDSIPTIVLSQPEDTTTVLHDYPINIQMSSTALHLNDGFTTIDKLGEIKSIEIRIERDSIVYCKVNNSVEFGGVSSTWQPPFKMLDANRVLILEGATLSLVAKYYNKKISTLQLCNRISDIDYLPAGTVLRLSCCNDCK